MSESRPGGDSAVHPADQRCHGAAHLLDGLDKNLLKAIIRDPQDYYVNVHNAVFPNGAVRGQLA